MNKIKNYKESTFAIDLIKDAYNITDPVEIVDKVNECLNVNVTVSEVIDYLNLEEDIEKESWSINSKYIFND